MALTPISKELVADVHDYSRIMGMRPERGAAILASLGDRFRVEFEISYNHMSAHVQKYEGRQIQDMPDTVVLAWHVCEVYRVVHKVDEYARQKRTADLTLHVALSDDLLDTFRRKGNADGSGIGEALAVRIYLGLRFMTRISQCRDELDRLGKRQEDAAVSERAESTRRVVDWADKKVIDPVFDMFDEARMAGSDDR